MAALPVGKLFLLVVRQVAKPVSIRLQAKAAQNETFRKFCIGIAQANNRIEKRIHRWAYGYGNEYVRPLDEAKAISNGSEFLGEVFIFSVAGSIVTFEYVRSQRKEAERENRFQEEFRVLQDKVSLLEEQLQRLHPGQSDRLAREAEAQEVRSRHASSSEGGGWWRAVTSTVSAPVDWISSVISSSSSSPPSPPPTAPGPPAAGATKGPSGKNEHATVASETPATVARTTAQLNVGVNIGRPS